MNCRTEVIKFDGSDIFYRVTGDIDKSPMLLVHGLAGDSRFFHNQLKHFGKERKAVAIDLPGHGRSVYSGNISLDLYNSVLEHVIEKERLNSYILVGHSMGGVISLYHYLKNRHTVKALVLVSTSHILPIEKELIDASKNDLNGLIDNMIPKIFHRKTGMFLIAARKYFGQDIQKTVTGDLILCSGINFEDQLTEIKIPVLIIANRHDKMVPLDLSVSMHLKISGSKIAIFDDCGHVPFYENSERFNDEVDRFIAEIQ